MTSPIFQQAAYAWSEMRAEFDVVLEAAYAQAEEGTHGAVLNKLGRREGVDPFSLLTGPWSRVLKYGAPELVEYFERNGRPSLARFEAAWVEGRNAATWEVAS